MSLCLLVALVNRDRRRYEEEDEVENEEVDHMNEVLMRFFSFLEFDYTISKSNNRKIRNDQVTVPFLFVFCYICECMKEERKKQEIDYSPNSFFT